MIIEPVFVVGAPRSGVRLVYESLSVCQGVFTREESSSDPLAGLRRSPLVEQVWDSDCMGVEAAAPSGAVSKCQALFEAHLRDRDDLAPDGTTGVGRMCTLEFGLQNALRVPFLRAVFPGARFVVVDRDAPAAVSSLIEAWESGQFVTYPDLPGWEGSPWSFPLVEGWHELNGAGLAAVATYQWSSISERLGEDLAPLPPADVVRVPIEDFLADPAGEVRRIGELLEWVVDRPPPRPLPLTRSTVSVPNQDKWRAANPGLASLVESDPHAPGQYVDPVSAPGLKGGATANLFESTYSLSVLDLLAASSCSLMVSTYQSGRLISLREQDGKLNTHFRLFDAPMGVACSQSALVVATAQEIHGHQNHAGAARVMAPPGSHDACYLPRNTHMTGDMGVHEVEVPPANRTLGYAACC